jgi:nitrous oxidase accessory protein
LRLFHLSPASDALDLAAKAFPIFAPQPRMSDPAPLMQPPTLPTTPGLAPPPTVLSLISAAGMTVLALAILAAGLRRGKRRRRIFSAQSA